MATFLNDSSSCRNLLRLIQCFTGLYEALNVTVFSLLTAGFFISLKSLIYAVDLIISQESIERLDWLFFTVSSWGLSFCFLTRWINFIWYSNALLQILVTMDTAVNCTEMYPNFSISRKIHPSQRDPVVAFLTNCQLHSWWYILERSSKIVLTTVWSLIVCQQLLNFNISMKWLKPVLQTYLICFACTIPIFIAESSVWLMW